MQKRVKQFLKENKEFLKNGTNKSHLANETEMSVSYRSGSLIESQELFII